MKKEGLTFFNRELLVFLGKRFLKKKYPYISNKKNFFLCGYVKSMVRPKPNEGSCSS